jgi:hypothetical protein
VTGIRCFLLEPTDRAAVSLRRYSKGTDHKVCPVTGFHTAMTPIGEGPAGWDVEDKVWRGPGLDAEKFLMPTDPRWPEACACGYRFCDCGQADCLIDAYQVFWNVIYRRVDTDEKTMLRDAPVGAMWFADWFSRAGPDGRTLAVRLPGDHDWLPDYRASNCTMPEDHEHRCWVRHGTPPDVTVDKDGNTCEAGAGSIGVPGWHGFLRDGYLME